MTENSDGVTAGSSRLGEILRLTATEMRNRLTTLRAAFDHATTKGDVAEENVRAFLRERLPRSIEVTSGQVIDTSGRLSAQMDVILYDALRTPLLFTSPTNGQHLVPVEGVIAAVEVKSILKRSQLPGIYANCRSVKTLEKRAFFGTSVEVRRRLYGAEWLDLPVLYSVFAFESEGLYAGPINEMQSSAALHERIDLVCYLDRGVNLNAHVDLSTYQASYGATGEPGGFLVDIADPERSLLLWYAALSSVVMQADSRPIDLTQYLAGELAAQGAIPNADIVESIKRQALDAESARMGIDPSILRKIEGRQPVSFEEYVSFFMAGGLVTPGPDTPDDQVEFLDRAREELDAQPLRDRPVALNAADEDVSRTGGPVEMTVI